MISLTQQERNVLIFLCFLLALGLFLTHGQKAAGCGSCFVQLYGNTSSSAPVDVNQATLRELVAVPGIGEKTAEAILRVRSLKGRFNSVEELRVVRGLSEKKLHELRKYLFVTHLKRKSRG
jgi:competence ComEA-like helix-hairpin-helix protein